MIEAFCENMGYSTGNGYSVDHHGVVDFDYLGSTKKRRACFLHEFTHCIDNCESNHKNSAGVVDDTFKGCVMSCAGVKAGTLTYCPDCMQRVLDNL